MQRQCARHSTTRFSPRGYLFVRQRSLYAHPLASHQRDMAYADCVITFAMSHASGGAERLGQASVQYCGWCLLAPSCILCMLWNMRPCRFLSFACPSGCEASTAHKPCLCRVGHILLFAASFFGPSVPRVLRISTFSLWYQCCALFGLATTTTTQVYFCFSCASR